MLPCDRCGAVARLTRHGRDLLCETCASGGVAVPRLPAGVRTRADGRPDRRTVAGREAAG